MPAVLEKATTVYGKGQTTIPVDVRRALGVTAGDSVTFRVEGDGTVLVQKTAEDRNEDPALAPFLGFLADDLKARPRAIAGLTASLEARLRELTGGTSIDRDRDCIEGDVGL
jgi:antitoxin PrlF